MYKLLYDNPNTILKLELSGDIFIPNGNPLWQEYQDWLAVGNIPEQADKPTPDVIARKEAEKIEYRRKREAAYKEELSLEGRFETSVGDLFDAILKAIYQVKSQLELIGLKLDTTELDTLMTVINNIKNKYPS